jgi:Mlc titration factor MtfA (ptsG expression regulator)
MKGAFNDLASAVFLKLARIATWRETQRREAVLSRPFPTEWAERLERRSAHYRRLPGDYRDRFKEQIQIFNAEKRITGVRIELTEETRLLVAASAVSLTVGWPGYTWDQLTEVLIYPQDFDRDYTFEATEMSGLAHHWGTVILSNPVLDRSFDESTAPYHVGFHEFAHLLDLSQTRFDGIPSHLSDDSIRQWTRILETEEERLHRGESVLDPYALSGPVELFAVAVEAFFQTPAALMTHHGELYDFLSAYFCQDPAAWSNADYKP